MFLQSNKTFQEERNSFRGIKRIFWEEEHEYPTDPFSGIVEARKGGETPLLSEAGYESDLWSDRNASVSIGTTPGSEIRNLRRIGLLTLDRDRLINRSVKADENRGRRFSRFPSLFAAKENRTGSRQTLLSLEYLS